MIEVSIAETRKRLTELLRLSQAGESVIITRRGKPVGQLARLSDEPGRCQLDINAMRQNLMSMPMGKNTLPSLLKMRREAR